MWTGQAPAGAGLVAKTSLPAYCRRWLSSMRGQSHDQPVSSSLTDQQHAPELVQAHGMVTVYRRRDAHPPLERQSPSASASGAGKLCGPARSQRPAARSPGTALPRRQPTANAALYRVVIVRKREGPYINRPSITCDIAKRRDRRGEKQVEIIRCLNATWSANLFATSASQHADPRQHRSLIDRYRSFTSRWRRGRFDPVADGGAFLSSEGQLLACSVRTVNRRTNPSNTNRP
jgi:hypothetical protein